MLETIAIERYEKHLLGKKGITLHGTIQEKEKAAKDIVHYAIAELLEWGPEEASEHLTADIVNELKLKKILRHIHFTIDIDPEKDIDYLACIAYPQYPYNIRQQILRVYERVQNGEIDRFPKKIFEGTRGREKAAILLSEFISKNMIIESIEQLYEKFADSANMNTMLRKAKMFSAARKLYATPLDYLHNSLPDDMRDDFLYAVWQYASVSKIAVNEIKRTGHTEEKSAS